MSLQHPFHDILRARRVALGLSPRQVANRVGVSEDTATLWETGKRIPRPSRLNALADVLVLDVDVLRAVLGYPADPMD